MAYRIIGGIITLFGALLIQKDSFLGGIVAIIGVAIGLKGARLENKGRLAIDKAKRD